MARASTSPTHLSLDEYARVMGLDPMHFSGGASNIRPEPTCSDVWFQYDWQNPKIVSREQIQWRIWEAERDIADAIGYWVAPRWIEDEKIKYDRPYRRDVFGLGSDTRWQWKTIQTRYGYVIEGGRRATTLLNDEVTWQTIDADGDGFDEIAEFTFTVAATLDCCEVKAYFKEYDEHDAANSRTDVASIGADPAWEVRPISTVLSGTTLTVYTNTWQLFRPQLQEALNAGAIPADDFGTGGVDLGSYVDALAFYRVYNDPANQVEFVWPEGSVCVTDACKDETQTGCISIKDSRNGLVVPQPSVYNEDTGVFMSSSTWDGSVEPEAVRLWYRAGLTPSYPTRGCMTLDPCWAKTIAMLATARLEYPLCDCTNVRNVSDWWRRDVRDVTRERSFQATQKDLENPFGTRIGEILAWRNVCQRGRRKGKAICA